MNKIWLNTSFESSQCNCIFFPLRLSWRHDFTRELSFEADGSRWFEGLRPQGWCETEMTWSNSNKVRTDESTSLQVKMMAMQVLLASCPRQWATPRLCLLGSAGLRSDFCKTAKLKDFFTQVWAELASSSRGRAEKAWTTVPAQAEEGKKHGETQCVRRVSHVSCWKNLPSKNLDSILKGTRGDTMCQHSLVVCGS